MYVCCCCCRGGFNNGRTTVVLLSDLHPGQTGQRQDGRTTDDLPLIRMLPTVFVVAKEFFCVAC